MISSFILCYSFFWEFLSSLSLKMYFYFLEISHRLFFSLPPLQMSRKPTGSGIPGNIRPALGCLLAGYAASDISELKSECYPGNKEPNWFLAAAGQNRIPQFSPVSTTTLPIVPLILLPVRLQKLHQLSWEELWKLSQQQQLIYRPTMEDLFQSLFLVKKTHVECSEGGEDKQRRRSDATFSVLSILPLNSLSLKREEMDVLFFQSQLYFQQRTSKSLCLIYFRSIYRRGEVSCISLPLSETPDVARHPTASFAIIRLCWLEIVACWGDGWEFHRTPEQQQ